MNYSNFNHLIAWADKYNINLTIYNLKNFHNGIMRIVASRDGKKGEYLITSAEMEDPESFRQLRTKIIDDINDNTNSYKKRWATA